MARNGSGTYSVPNSFTSGATISSSAVNANFSDVGSEITGSLPRDGQAGMTGQLKAAAGSATAPGITFDSDTNSGFYRKSADTIGVAVGGTEVGEFSSKGTTFIPTGCLLPYGATSAPTGWVRANGRTMGNASSSGTERANADTETLFSFLWTNYADAVCAVSTGRGASAAADYAANKTITLPDLRGRGFFGLDDMGGSAASRLGTVVTSATTNGSSGGTETVTLSSSEMPSHTHTLSAHTHAVSGTSGNNSVAHTHSFSATTSSDGAHTHTEAGTVAKNGTNGSDGFVNSAAGTTGSSGSHTHTVSGTSGNNSVDHTHSISLTSGAPSSDVTGSTGSTSAHSNMPPAFLGTWIIKL